ncbi:MAG: hypothetical protein HQK76_08065 [Desulfobacterales bacterium]|nr:hypothetical protein [Desulfobacterales bacterium]
MWIFNKDGFFSIVRKNCKFDEIMVQARSKEDLISLSHKIGVESEIIEAKKEDYKYRIIIRKKLISEYITKYIDEIDYDNVRSNIVPKDDKNRQNAYQQVYETMFNWLGIERPFSE